MRKFILCLISVVIAITCLGVVGFAAETDFYYGDLVVNDTTATVNLYFEPEADGTREYISALEAYYTVENGTVGDTGYEGEVPGMECASSNVTGLISFYCDSYTDASDANVVNKFTITREGDAKTSVITLKDVCVNDYNGDDIYATYPETYTITWPSNDPLPKPNGVSTTFVASNGTTYTNVPNAEVSATIPAGGVTGGNILATYWKNGFTELKTATIPFGVSDAKVTGTGTVSFDVAITGVPTTVVITEISIAFN